MFHNTSKLTKRHTMQSAIICYYLTQHTILTLTNKPKLQSTPTIMIQIKSQLLRSPQLHTPSYNDHSITTHSTYQSNVHHESQREKKTKLRNSNANHTVSQLHFHLTSQLPQNEHQEKKKILQENKTKVNSNMIHNLSTYHLKSNTDCYPKISTFHLTSFHTSSNPTPQRSLTNYNVR